MKKLIFVFVLLVARVSAQIPNFSFEQWTSNSPNYWHIFYFNFCADCYGEPTTKSHNGGLAVKMKIHNVNQNPYVCFGRPLVTSSSSGEYIPFSLKPSQLTFWLLLNNNLVDTTFATIDLKSNGSIIGTGSLVIGTKDTIYKKYTINIVYTNSAQPDEARISFGWRTGSSCKSYFIVDELSTDADVGIKDLADVPSIEVYYSQADSKLFFTGQKSQAEKIKVEILDVTGHKVYESLFIDEILLDERFLAGIYVVKISGEDGSVLYKKILI
jgi:hypothetical protein